MAFTNANLLMNHPTARWLIEKDPTILQIARVMPFLGIDGDSIRYARRTTELTNAAIVNDGAAAIDNSGAAEDIEFGLNEFISTYKIKVADLDRYDRSDAAQYALALRADLYGYFAWLDTVLPSLGIQTNLSSAPLTLDTMDAAYHEVRANDGRPTIIMTSTRILLWYNKLCRATNYEPPMVPWQWYDPAVGQMVSGFAPAFNGTPILINDKLASGSSETAEDQRIYFMVLGDDGKAGPTRGVTGIVPERLKGTMFVKRTTMGDWSSGVEEPNTIATTWVSWPVGIAVGAERALSVLTNFSAPE